MIWMNELGSMNTGCIQIGVIVWLCASFSYDAGRDAGRANLEPSFRAAKIEGGHPHKTEGTRD